MYITYSLFLELWQKQASNEFLTIIIKKNTIWGIPFFICPPTPSLPTTPANPPPPPPQKQNKTKQNKKVKMNEIRTLQFFLAPFENWNKKGYILAGTFEIK